MNADEFLVDLSPEAPCGDNLEYDPLYLELEQVAQGKPEVQYGTTITPAIPPDWKSVKKLSIELLTRSRDLRLAVKLSRALLALEGVVGFSSGLSLIERLLDERWQSVHPQLDPDDDNDPMLRINTLVTLAEPTTLLHELRNTELVSSQTAGSFSLRDIELASGEFQPGRAESVPALSVIDGAFSEIDLDQLKATHSALERAYLSSSRIESILTEKVGAARSVDLSPLTKMLKKALDLVVERVLGRIGSPIDAQESTESESGENMPSTNHSQMTTSFEVNNREDVQRLLKLIIAYYAVREPSSPVPFLLQRAQKLVDLNFMEILKEIAAGGIEQVKSIVGDRT